jgi:hypothetical protein
MHPRERVRRSVRLPERSVRGALTLRASAPPASPSVAPACRGWPQRVGAGVTLRAAARASQHRSWRAVACDREPPRAERIGQLPGMGDAGCWSPFAPGSRALAGAGEISGAGRTTPKPGCRVKPEARRAISRSGRPSRVYSPRKAPLLLSGSLLALLWADARSVHQKRHGDDCEGAAESVSRWHERLSVDFTAQSTAPTR